MLPPLGAKAEVLLSQRANPPNGTTGAIMRQTFPAPPVSPGEWSLQMSASKACARAVSPIILCKVTAHESRAYSHSVTCWRAGERYAPFYLFDTHARRCLSVGCANTKHHTPATEMTTDALPPLRAWRSRADVSGGDLPALRKHTWQCANHIYEILISRHLPPPRFFMALGPISWVRSSYGR
jgi:hypothetical protein